MDIPTIKWTYRNCHVEITILFDSPAKVSVTPVVEIDCHAPGLQTLLTTGKSFLTTEQAEEYGQEMAREWIDKYRKRREEQPAGGFISAENTALARILTSWLRDSPRASFAVARTRSASARSILASRQSLLLASRSSSDLVSMGSDPIQ